MDEWYPIMIKLARQSCVIVGGGRIGARKATALSRTGAHVTVISPELHPVLEALAGEGSLHVVREVYQTALLTRLNPRLVIACTNNTAVNDQVIADAENLGALVNAAHDADKGDVMMMAHVRQNNVLVAVCTGGVAPALSARLAKRLSATILAEDMRVADEALAQKQAKRDLPGDL